MINITNIWKYDLRKGSTNHPSNGACLFDAGMWLVYGQIGDNPPCSCPVIRAYATRLNDSMPDEERQRLKPFILRVVGNRDPEAEPARLRYLVLETARRIVPVAFDGRWPELAREMRALPDDAAFPKIQKLMRKASAEAAASAAAWAADTARAAAWAAEAARAHADRATEAAYAANDEAIAILDGVLRIGKQSPEFDEAEVRRSVEMFEMERVR